MTDAPPRYVGLAPSLVARLMGGQDSPAAREFVRRTTGPGCLGEAMVAHGRVVAAGGIIPHWPGRAEGWWLSRPDATRRELTLFARRTAAFLDRVQAAPAFRRVEMFCRADAPWRDSFAAALGFEFEGALRAWGPDGADHMIFARVRP